MYAGAPGATHDQSVGLIAGSCLGGGTVVNYSTSFRTPDDVRAEWASLGVPAFASADYTAALDAVCERLGVNQEHNEPSARERKLRDACLALGWHVDAMPRNVDGRCDQGRDCGYCGFGCRRGAKQSTTKTWLPDAQAAGARIVVGVDRRARDGRRRRRARRGRDDRRGPPSHRPLARGRRRLRRAADAGAAEALGPDEPERRQAPAAAPGDRRRGDLRRGGAPVGGDDAGALLRPATATSTAATGSSTRRPPATRTWPSRSCRGAARVSTSS